MSILVDKQYVNFVSSQLSRFRWIRDNVARATCPVCGDGKTGKKTRFYIFSAARHGSDGLFAQCKNCGFSKSFGNFLKDFDNSLYSEYRLEKFRSKHGRDPYQKKKESIFIQPTSRVQIRLDTETPAGCVFVSDLDKEHPCRVYVEGRNIPYKYQKYLMYADNFRKFVEGFVEDETDHDSIPTDSRLIIPFYDEFKNLVCAQGRSLDSKNKMRYITIKRTQEEKKIFGLDRIDRSKEVKVVEGPIDSLFLVNTIATADADLTSAEGDVYIYDNQYRNRDVCKHISKAIDMNKKVVLFPRDFGWKDINDAVSGGYSSEALEKLITENTFQGLKAKMVFQNLKGC